MLAKCRFACLRLRLRGRGAPCRSASAVIVLVLGLLLQVLLPAQAAQPAQATPRILRVVTDNNYPPYLFLNSLGQPEGYLVDLWKLWQAKTGVKVDLEPMQWAAAQRAMHDGKADVIDMIFRTPVRDQIYEFSNPYSTQRVGIYVDHNIHGVTGPRSLRGFTVGVERGDACIDKLGSLGITRLATYPNYLAMFKAVKSGEIKMVCADDDPANYYLYLLGDQLRVSRTFTLYDGRFHWAVNRGDAATFALVSRGMTMITPAERAQLQRKWFSHPIQFLPYLRFALIGVASALGFLGLAFGWIWILRRAVRARTREIAAKSVQVQEQASQLAHEHAQLLALINSSPDLLWMKNTAGVYMHCNAAAARFFGLSPDQVIGRTDAQLHTDSDFVALVQRVDQEVLASGAMCQGEERLRGKDGVAHDLEVVKVPIHGPDGVAFGVLGVGRDITARRYAERELRLAAVAFESHDGVIVTDSQGVIERVNTAFTAITGYSAADAVGKTPALWRSGRHGQAFYDQLWASITTDGQWSGEIVDQRRNGELFTARMSITAVRDPEGRIAHYVATFQDITAERQAIERAEHLELFDPLTNLPNRALLDDRLNHALATSSEIQQYAAVLMVDLDEFQRINDALGHKVGDDLLREVAARIQLTAREGDTISRFSGDSFVVLAEDLGSSLAQAVDLAKALAERVRQAVAKPALVDGQPIVCTASVGVTLWLGHSVSAEILLRQAELAMYKSKRSGRNTTRFFEDAMQAEVELRTRVERQLRLAIDLEQFELYYQAQVDGLGHVIGAEALLRWRHPERGLVAPGEFIALAEETGLIEPIGRWVLLQACRQLAQWAASEDLRDLALSVNVSVRQFQAPGFGDEVLAEVARFGVPPGKLKLEITESLAIDDFDASIGKLRALRDAGILLSIDDFGTGNSSLKYLTKLPLTQLKIDKSFVDHLPSSPSDATVAQTIIAMGNGLGLQVIAEGVETAQQRDWLAAHGCHAYQGYLFGKPLPLEEFKRSVGFTTASAAF